jgi:serine/threonine-protein kinase
LQHPHIVQIHEIGQFKGLPYFSMEFVDGGTLQTLVGGKPQQSRSAAALIETLARAMQFAHDRNIIHRDLKPANILLAGKVEAGAGLASDKTLVSSSSSSGTVSEELIAKITDFGLAKGIEEDATQATQAGTIMGTPSYMAPEQARGDIAMMGPACDQYSLGAILYELLTGRPPFQGATMLETLDQVRNREPVPPTQLQPKVPIDLETICLKCLQKDPIKRYGSCGALADDLGHFLRGEPIVARPISQIERTWRWCRRNPWVAGLSATATLLLVGIAVGSVIVAMYLSAKNRDIENEKNAAVQAEQKAKVSEEKAIAARKQADLNAQETATQAGIALQAIQTLVDKVQQRLNDSPANQELKEELLKFALEETKKIDVAGEKSTSIEATRMHTLHRLGELYRQLGQTERAMANFKEVDRIARERVVLKQGTSASRFNRIIALWPIADIEREVQRDMKAALAHEIEALDIAKDINEHPKTDENGEGSVDKSVIRDVLADCNKRVGVIYLRLGEIPTAADYFRESLQSRRQRLSDVYTNPKSTPLDKVKQDLALALILMALGDTAYRMGDSASAIAYFNEAQKIQDALMQKYSAAPFVKRYAASACMLIGDFYLRAGNNDVAARLFNEALKLTMELRAADQKLFDYKWDLTFAHYRLGQLALRMDDPASAKNHFEESRKLRDELAMNDKINERRKMELMLAQAHCGLDAEAAKLAQSLEKSVKPDAEFQIDLGRTYAQCFAGTTNAKLKAQYSADALRVLRAAVESGYRDTVYLEREVDLDPLRNLPEFASVVTLSRGTKK